MTRRPAPSAHVGRVGGACHGSGSGCSPPSVAPSPGSSPTPSCVGSTGPPAPASPTAGWCGCCRSSGWRSVPRTTTGVAGRRAAHPPSSSRRTRSPTASRADGAAHLRRSVAGHLFGASVGREGAALQMAGSVTDTASRLGQAAARRAAHAHRRLARRRVGRRVRRAVHRHRLHAAGRPSTTAGGRSSPASSSAFTGKWVVDASRLPHGRSPATAAHRLDLRAAVQARRGGHRRRVCIGRAVRGAAEVRQATHGHASCTGRPGAPSSAARPRWR